MPFRRTRRVVRRSRTVRRHWGSAALAGAGSLAYGVGRKAYDAVQGMRRARGAVRDATNAVRRYTKTKSVGNALFGPTPLDTNQFTEKRLVTGSKKATTVARLARELHNKNETTILRYSGMNNFNDNGFFWCGKNILAASSRTDLPVYVFDLTSCINVPLGVQASAKPLIRANISNLGLVRWTQSSGQQSDGTTLSADWQFEKYPSSTSSMIYPHEKSRLLWTDVRMNLFGAKNKAIKYTIQIIKLTDDCYDPYSGDDLIVGTSDQQKYNTFWQGVIKPYTYNPLALTSADRVKGMKVLKSYSTIIQPNATIEGDQDPHIKVLKWFMRWDRDISYAEGGNYIGTAAEVTEAADYSVQNIRVTTQPKSMSKILLLIRASAYQQQTDSAVDNTVSPSFDLCVRAKHVIT